jgi:hypothetical protein
MEHRPGIAAGAGFCIQRHLEHGKVAEAAEDLAAGRHRLEIDLRQDARKAILAAQRHHHTHRRVGRRVVQLSQAPGIGVAKALEHTCRVEVVVHGAAMGTQASDAVVDGCLVKRLAAWSDDGDADGWIVHGFA